jgi:HSP20 family molecular chaperone IbpA
MKLAYCASGSGACAGWSSGLDVFLKRAGVAAASSSGWSGGVVQRLAMDALEDDVGYRVLMEVPGVKREDVKLDLVGRELKVAAVRKVGEDSRSVSRVLKLPDDADAGGISASLVDGLLTLSFPRLAEARGRSITVA